MTSDAGMTPRQKNRQATEAAVLEIANRHLDADGAQSLSLRAVARDLGVVSSAVYRYVRSRDELLTLLITDAYDRLADTVDAAVARDDSLESVAFAMLDWSRRHPRRWELIHGSPVADYRAPRDTVIPGTRVAIQVARLVAALDDATDDPRLSSESAARDPAALWLARDLDELGLAIPPHSALRAVSVWASLLGMVNMLRFGQLGPESATWEDHLMRTHVLRLICGTGTPAPETLESPHVPPRQETR
ncbi:MULTISPECIES: TetR/AcrR family transcriptional regulator [unclassified Nesterenkonia]|uniref:TetR/AcrR family transcriptional regulator n=1 Tax=unclassified Nesterenkonia TaxID=2629769 RepID=UPI0008721B63|nr:MULTISPECIES: TetR/AcrR family transcriptional regulator [unclassified Nesterenkonia]MDS2172850.1 TetR/AcrR family transcriptional regulator [Nesterenkonia sp. CL21]